MFEGFEEAEVNVGETTIFIRQSGKGPPLLFLHGFPQTHLMWRGVAPILAQRFSTICADLRGYGRSGCPDSEPDHSPYTKRAMAHDMLKVMEKLGFDRFSVVGHDRGGRVAYRMALDYPTRVSALALLDIAPTEDAWKRADSRFALAFWPWSLLAQPAPLPERLLLAAPEAVIDDALGGWGSPSTTFPPQVRAAYIEALRDFAHVHSICEEYRAAAALDRLHDQTDWESGRRILCPLLLLWSGRGPLESWYRDVGGPLALWRNWGDDIRGSAVNAGHFFPEETPEETAALLKSFFDESVMCQK